MAAQTTLNLPNVTVIIETDPRETMAVPSEIATNDVLLLQALVATRPQVAGATIQRENGTIKVVPKIKRNG